MDNEKIIERLLGFFQLKLAQIEKELGIANGTLGKFRQGKTGLPQKFHGALLSKGLNPEYFLTGEGSPELPKEVIPASVQERIIPFIENLLSADSQDKLLTIPGSQDFPDLKALIFFSSASVHSAPAAFSISRSRPYKVSKDSV